MDLDVKKTHCLIQVIHLVLFILKILFIMNNLDKTEGLFYIKVHG